MTHDQYLEASYAAQDIQDSIREAAVKDEADYLMYIWREHSHAQDAALHSEVLAEDIGELIFVAANKLADLDQDKAMAALGRFVIDLLQKEALRLAEEKIS